MLYVFTFMYVAQQITNEICTQGTWRHFSNTNSYLAAIFLLHHRHYLLQSWCFMARSKTNDECFPGVSTCSRPDLSMSTRNLKIGKLFLTQDSPASLWMRSTTKRLYITMCTVLSITVKRIEWLQVEVTSSPTQIWPVKTLSKHENFFPARKVSSSCCVG